MKKKAVAMLMAAMVMASMAPATTYASFDVEAQFEPNAEYERYTVFEFTLEALSTDIIVTLCARGENEYEILTNFYGDDQDWVGTYDGTAVTTISDKTGFMEGDAPAIIQAGIDADNWVAIGDAAPAEDAAADTAAKKPVDFGVEPEFEAKEGYPIFTVLEYTIESLSTDIVATVSANEEFTEFDIQCNFYGDDQDWEGTYDAAAETVETKADKTGFMEGDAPAIIKAAIEKDLWAWTADGTSIKEEPAADDAVADDAAAGDVTFDVEPEFDPNPDYEKYTVFEYTLEALSTDIIVTLCAKGENEYEILTNFYGDDQDWAGTYDGTAVTTTSDKTGFMEGDAPAIIQAGIDADNWAPIQ